MTEEAYRKALLTAEGMRIAWKAGDVRRDAGLKTPEDVVRTDNILYGPYGKWNSMDIYYPKAAVSFPKSAADGAEGESVSVTDADGNRFEGIVEKHLPIIVNIHGGGWQYGDKELYQYYAMSLAERGFGVINFTYRLAPDNAMPAMFIDVNRVFCWIAANASKYGLDPQNVFVLGDSAGGHMASWYMTLFSSPAYRTLYRESFPAITKGLRRTVPAFTMEDYRAAMMPEDLIKDIPQENMRPDEEYIYEVPTDRLRIPACALNCGIYDVIPALRVKPGESLGETSDGALGSAACEMFEKDPYTAYKLVDSWNYMTADYPVSFIMSAAHDFLLPCAEPMFKHLTDLGAQAELHVYGTKEQDYMAHVFHVNVKLKEAALCNDEECAFFRRFLV